VKNSFLKHLVLLVALLGCASGTSAMTNVRVEFVKPENYIDVSFRSMTPQAARERLIGEPHARSKTAPPSLCPDMIFMSGSSMSIWPVDRAFEAPGMNSDLRIR
jgi:hypothetical protein